MAAAIASRTDWRDVGQVAASPAIAWTDTPWADRLTSTMGAALAAVVRACSEGGAAVKQVRWPVRFVRLADAQRTVQVFETARAFAAEFDDRRDGLSPLLAALIEEGRGIEANAYLAALQAGRECATSIDDLFGDADVVLAPSAPGEAPHGLGSTGDPQFNRAWHYWAARRSTCRCRAACDAVNQLCRSVCS